MKCPSKSCPAILGYWLYKSFSEAEYNYFRVIDLKVVIIGWIMAHKDIRLPSLETVNITSCGKIFADVIKLMVLRQGDYPE